MPTKKTYSIKKLKELALDIENDQEEKGSLDSCITGELAHEIVYQLGMINFDLLIGEKRKTRISAEDLFEILETSTENVETALKECLGESFTQLQETLE
jgi:hypothetical protein